jgi:hypothetical protein
MTPLTASVAATLGIVPLTTKRTPVRLTSGSGYSKATSDESVGDIRFEQFSGQGAAPALQRATPAHPVHTGQMGRRIPPKTRVVLDHLAEVMRATLAD